MYLFLSPEADGFLLGLVEVSLGLRVTQEGAEVRGVRFVRDLDKEAFVELKRARKLAVDLPDAVLKSDQIESRL